MTQIAEAKAPFPTKALEGWFATSWWDRTCRIPLSRTRICRGQGCPPSCEKTARYPAMWSVCDRLSDSANFPVASSSYGLIRISTLLTNTPVWFVPLIPAKNTGRPRLIQLGTNHTGRPQSHSK